MLEIAFVIIWVMAGIVIGRAWYNAEGNIYSTHEMYIVSILCWPFATIYAWICILLKKIKAGKKERRR